MVCEIKVIQNYATDFLSKKRIYPTFKGNPLTQLTTDVCQFSKRKYSQSELLDILKGDFRKLTKSFLDSLSEEDYKFCLSYAKSDEKYWMNPITNEDVRDISRYCDILMRGIKKIAPNKKVKVVSIGQSPAVLTQGLSVKGVDTGVIPISGLRESGETINQIVKSKDGEDYFKYLKENFDIDFNNLDKDTTYIFTDYTCSGGSIRNFKKLLDAKQIKGDNINVLPLQEIVKQANLNPAEAFFIMGFQMTKLQSPYLKFMYSPIFKMPIDDLKHIALRHANSQCATTRRGNKLQVLLYDYQKSPQDYQVSKYPCTMKERIDKAEEKINSARLINGWEMACK